MKNFALLTAVAIIALPLSANAGQYHSERAQTRDATVSSSIVMPENVRIQPQQFVLNNVDGSIMIEGKKIYFIEPDGDKYFAPDGPYETRNGVTYYAHDGLVSLIEAPQNIVYVDASVMDNNADGYYDDIDVNVDTRTHSYGVNN